MPKRSADMYNTSKNKRKRIEKDLRRRRYILTSDSSDSEDNSNIGTPPPDDDTPTVLDEDKAKISDASEIIILDAPVKSKPVAEEPPIPDLDPEILLALGVKTDDGSQFGNKIHEQLSQLWTPLLKEGMVKENKDKLLKKYLIPQNCTLLQAPKLNAEIFAAIKESARNRDKNMSNLQQQLGVGITAVNRAIDLLLYNNNNKVKIIKHLRNACHILCDLHNCETQARIKMIKPILDKSFLNIIQDARCDETLFGNKLSEKIKASKSIEKQGLQINKVVSNPTPAASSSVDTQNRGNWSDPPRYVSSQTKRKVSKKTSSSKRKTHQQSAPPSKPTNIDMPANTCTSTTVTQGSSPAIQTSYPGCREALRSRYTRTGCPAASLDPLLASISKSTMQKFDSTLKLWWKYCESKSVDPYNCSNDVVIDFLTEQSNRKISYNTLNSHRSALSFLLSNNNIRSDERIKRILKGALKLNSSKSRHISIWKPQKVLNYICNWPPNSDIPVEKLAKKLVTLLALCTAHKVQTFAHIKIDDIHVTSDGINIVMTNIIETSGFEHEQPDLFLSYYKENPKICPATTLKSYIDRTRHVRNGTQNLILSSKPPYKTATVQTICRWIKSVLSESGVAVSENKEHSHSTTAESMGGISIETILKKAAWTYDSSSFAKVYKIPLTDDATCAKAALIDGSD